MHISRIYIQDNFVPDFDTDPFRRKVFGMEVTINEGDNAGDGIADLEKRISEYITANTIPPTHSMRGTQETVIQEPKDTKEQEDKIKNEYAEVEVMLNSFEFQEDAIAYLNTTTFKHFIPAKIIANSKPIKNK